MKNAANENEKGKPGLSNFSKSLGVILIFLTCLAVVGVVVWFIFFVKFVDNYELAFSYDRMTGKIEKIERTGWIFRTPIRHNVHAIDLRPYQVSISANSRILNAKLVRFDPKGLDKFVEWHGRDAGDYRDNMLEILKSYAFARDAGKSCPFLVVLDEVAPSQTLDASVAGTPTPGGK